MKFNFISFSLKTLIYMILLFNVSTELNAQDKEFQSRISRNECVSVNYHLKDGIAFYSRVNVDCSAEIVPAVYNVANVEVHDDQFIIPANGEYWIIPFDNRDPVQITDARYTSWVLNCICYGTGTCSVSWATGCLKCVVNSGCNHCDGQFIESLRTQTLNGGGLIIKAKNVVQN